MEASAYGSFSLSPKKSPASPFALPNGSRQLTFAALEHANLEGTPEFLSPGKMCGKINLRSRNAGRFIARYQKMGGYDRVLAEDRVDSSRSRRGRKDTIRCERAQVTRINIKALGAGPLRGRDRATCELMQGFRKQLYDAMFSKRPAEGDRSVRKGPLVGSDNLRSCCRSSTSTRRLWD